MDLGELILRNKGTRSYETLSRDCGGVPAAARLQQIGGRTKPLVNFPDPPSIRGLAKGLHVTERAVVLAAAESLGLDVGRPLPRLVDQLPAGTDALSDQEIAAVVTMVRTMLDSKERAEAELRAEMGLPASGARRGKRASTSPGKANTSRKRRAG